MRDVLIIIICKNCNNLDLELYILLINTKKLRTLDGNMNITKGP